MRISRLYIPAPLNTGQKIELDDNSAHYLRSVLRLKKEQTVIFFNGQGNEYSCVLGEVSRKRVIAKINHEIERTVESELNVTLGLGVSRGDRMDWAIQKSVELGVSQITPLITERCVVKFSEDKKKQRLQHWRNIVQHATEQSGRTILPKLNEVASIEAWVKHQKGLKVFLDPYADTTLTKLKPDNMNVTLLSGPEGGFSEQEREQAVLAGFTPVSMGRRILRTETAALAALSAVQMLWGDFV